MRKQIIALLLPDSAVLCSHSTSTLMDQCGLGYNNGWLAEQKVELWSNTMGYKHNVLRFPSSLLQAGSLHRCYSCTLSSHQHVEWWHAGILWHSKTCSYIRILYTTNSDLLDCWSTRSLVLAGHLLYASPLALRFTRMSRTKMVALARHVPGQAWPLLCHR